MATTKTSSKSPVSKTKRPKTPTPKTYTIKQLAGRWGYEEFEIESYIMDGHLKEAFDIDRLNANLSVPYFKLRDLLFYKHYVGDAELLKVNKNNSTLDEIMGTVEEDNIIPCSELDFLYLPKPEDAFTRSPREKWDWVRFFYDSDGNQLIPIRKGSPPLQKKSNDGYHIQFVPIDKHLFEELLIVPLEEVDRFEIEYKIGEKKKLPKNGKKILDILDEMKQHPRRLPLKDKQSGKYGIKNDVRQIYLKRYKNDDKVEDQFDDAWEALTDKGFIGYAD